MGAARSRVPLSTVVLGTLILIVIAVGTYLSSRAQPSTIAATDVQAKAVVVSSLACSDGSAGGTLVDVLNPAGMSAGSTVRASLDACGYQEGAQLAVLHPTGDPTQVSLASQEQGGDNATDARLLPFGLGAAGLLGALAALAVWLDRRRGRQAPRGRRAARGRLAPRGWRAARGRRGLPMAQDKRDEALIGPVTVPVAETTAELPAIVHDRPAGRHARPDADEPALAPVPEGFGSRRIPGPPEVVEAPAVADPPLEANKFEGEQLAARQGERPLPSVDLVYPFSPSLAASLHDELFTHRSVST